MARSARRPSRRTAIRGIKNPKRKPWPRRHGWIANDIDMAILSVAQHEFLSQRCRITLVPADPADPRNRNGRKLRVCESRTPRWYQELFYRRDQRAKHSIRQYVGVAIANMLATGYIRPRAMDAEILDVLYEFYNPRDWGYPDWAGALRLARNRYAERYRRHRRRRAARAS